MAPVTYDQEITCSIPPEKMFKAFVLDADNIIPKVLPQAIKKVDILEGDGGVGTIKLVTFGEGSQYKSVKHRVDAVDEANCAYSYSIIEGDVLEDGDLEKISYDVKIEPTADGGSVCKTKSTYHPKGINEIAAEKIKEGKERAHSLFKAIEGYLHANPHAYN
ncbi:major allergen Pru ar 1-like [Olea europaea subsp. europaea]|uniref:Major allergen Pru ar 1-like n=1 Tax=Olea europaea subsp. europaea TaxID=158383 RepID=A0A8S0SYD6_OLEEU|nr:major allergen Pru ar 1-like [Olea europaea subsp. europaea]